MSPTPAGRLLGEAVVLVFRANGLLLGAGDELAAPSGLTSARWQVLGVIDHAPATQSEVARTMGLTRQSVRETAAALQAEGLVEPRDNPHHRRAKLMAITVLGRRRLREVEARQASWASRITARLPRATLATLVTGMQQLADALEAEARGAPQAARAPTKQETKQEGKRRRA